MMSVYDIADCMSYTGHMAGEKCGPERIVSDRIVVARQMHDCCHVCQGKIAAGTHNRVSKLIWDGEFLSARICEACCRAMALWSRGKPELLEAQYELGNERINGPHDYRAAPENQPENM
jgi:hypothetical protein